MTEKEPPILRRAPSPEEQGRLHQEAINELHELELEAEAVVSDEELRKFQSAVAREKEREEQEKIAHLKDVQPEHLEKYEALVLRRARDLDMRDPGFYELVRDIARMHVLLERAGVGDILPGTAQTLLSRRYFYALLNNYLNVPPAKRRAYKL